MEKLSILIIDDSVADRTLYKEFLSQFSDYEYDYLEVSTGEDGIAAYRRRDPDCTIVDLILSGSENGMNVLTELSEREKREKPIIFITGLTRGEQDSKFTKDVMAMGARAHISKCEVTPQKLFNAIVDAVNHKMAA